ncbi:SusC/RagA family TonB-linked outer membrane protein [Niabella aquatica]
MKKLMNTLIVRMLAISMAAGISGAALGQETDTVQVIEYKTPFQIPLPATGSADSISGKRLLSFPVTNIEASLYGLLSGLDIRASSGDRFSGASLNLRGQAPLVVIDGIVRSWSALNPEQVESVSVLKDAISLTRYGMRGANGVLLITTRRGGISKPRISATAQTGVQQQLFQAKYLDAYNYSVLLNEAMVNEGSMARYTPSDLDLYKSGGDKFGHPNIDWRNLLTNKNAGMQRYNVNIDGGGAAARYHLDFDYLNQNGFLKSGKELNSYETKDYAERYIIRANVDVKATKTTTLGVNIFTRIRELNQPGATVSSIYNYFYYTPNNAYPVFNPRDSLAGTLQYRNNLYGNVFKSGYIRSFDRILYSDVAIRQEMPFIKGLYAKGLASFNYSFGQNINRSKTFPVYSMAIGSVNDTTYTQIGTSGAQANSISYSGQNRQFYMEGGLGHDLSKNNHNLHSELMYYVDRSDVGGSGDLPILNKSILNSYFYSYADKYFVDLSAAYSYFNRLPEKNRWGFFPSVGVGWKLSSEDWFALNAIDFLKVRASYGKVGNNLNIGNFSYLVSYAESGPAFYTGTSTSPTANATIVEPALVNDNLKWENSYNLNVGIDLGLLKNCLTISADYFNNNITDNLILRNSGASSIIGTDLTVENLGKLKYSGIDLSVDYNNGTEKRLNYIIGANIGLMQSRLVYADELPAAYSYMRRTGQPINQPFGYIADGFYNTQGELDKAPIIEGYTPQLGDIKFKDLNGDNRIDIFDETALGNKGPRVSYGLSFMARFSGFEFSMLWNGSQNNNVWTNVLNNLEFQTGPNNGIGQASEMHQNRWTAATASAATYPRLSLGYNPNNHRASSFWLKDGSYIRLKNVELAYNLPKNWVSHIRLQGIRFFVNGLNLLTFTKLEDMDPEITSSLFPNTRVFNCGVNVKF